MELYVICQCFYLILEKKIKQDNKKIQFSNQNDLSAGRENE